MDASRLQLVVQLEGQEDQIVLLTKPVITIGRLPDNDLPLPMPTVSGHHADIRLDPSGATLTDLNSRNGTFVGQTRLQPHQPYLLTHGTVFRIHPYTVLYQDPAQVAPPEPLTLSVPPAPVEEAAPAGGESTGVATTPVGEGSAKAEVTPTSKPRELVAQTGGAITNGPVLESRPAQEPRPLVVPAALGQELALVPNGRRPTFPLAGATASRSAYLQDLPVIFHDSDFLGRLLLVLESIWEPLERRQDHIAMYFDPHTCPSSFLAWLAGWLHFSINRHWPEARIRALVAEAMDLYAWRGTAYGLTRMIEVCTGLSPTVIESPAEPFCFRVSMHLPPERGVDRDLVEQLILAHKPAHAGYSLDLLS